MVAADMASYSACTVPYGEPPAAAVGLVEKSVMARPIKVFQIEKEAL